MGTTATQKRGVIPSFERGLNAQTRALKQDILDLGDRAKGMGNPKLAGALYALARATEDEGVLNRVASELLKSVEPTVERDEQGKLQARPEE